MEEKDREIRLLENLSEEEKTTYWECVALLQGIADQGDISEVCEILRKYSEKEE